MNLALIILIGLALRLLYLDEIPAEMWGDVIEHYEMTQDILRGSFFYNFRFGGDGPFFSYASALVAVVMRLSFFSLKITTAIGGVLSVILIFYFTLELFKNKKIAYLASFFSAVSFWSLSFSRQAKPHIFVPVFVLAALIFLLKKKDGIAGLVAGLGMYAQAGFFGFPILLFFLRKFKALAGCIFLSVPLVLAFIRDKTFLNKNSFFAEKISFSASGAGILNAVRQIAENFNKNILSFFWRGDSVSRHTISGYPHLDYVSFLFLVVGIVLILKEALGRKKHRYISHYLLPFFVLQIPSILDIAKPQSIPNMGRMIAVMPFAYIGTAYGFYNVWSYFKSSLLFRTELVGMFLLIIILNLYRFFVLYPLQLPNRNISFGKIIADKIDSYPANYQIIISGCCWGELGQPEPNGIRFRLQTPRTLHFFAADTNDEEISCEKIRSQFGKKQLALFFDPRKQSLISEIKKCLKLKTSYSIEKAGFEVVRVIDGHPKQ